MILAALCSLKDMLNHPYGLKPTEVCFLGPILKHRPAHGSLFFYYIGEHSRLHENGRGDKVPDRQTYRQADRQTNDRDVYVLTGLYNLNSLGSWSSKDHLC